MFKPKTTAILGLSLIFSFQPIFASPVNSQSLNFQIATQQNLSCQSQRSLLLKASGGLLYPSESDYPFQYFSNNQMSSLPTPQQFTQLIGQSGKTVTQVDFDEFLNHLIRNERSSGAEVATIKRYQSLRQAFKSQFSALTVYRVGQIQVQVYITGVNSSCGMAGLKTISIET